MKKVFLFFLGAVFYTAGVLAATDVVISRTIPTKNADAVAENVDNSRDKNESKNARSARRGGVENSGKSATRSTVTRNTQKTNVVSRNQNGKNVISRAPNNQKTTNARATLADGVNTVGRNTRVDAASINNTAAARRAGVILRASTAEVGGRATIGNTGVQTGSNIDEQVHPKRSRASIFGSSKKDVTPTAESISNAKDILEKTADLNNTCQQQYNDCMDQFCMVVDTNQKRCSCSANLAKYEKAQKAVEEANIELNEVAQNIRYIGLSANEIRAIFSATEAEEAMAKTKDNTQTRSLLEDIAEMIEDPSVASSASSSGGTDAMSMMDLDFSSDSSDMFSLDMFSGSKDISNKRGRDLYNEATKRCKSVLNACKEAGGTESQITGNYDLAIDKDCIAYEQGLKKLNDSLLANVRSANLMLQKARLSVLQNQNQYDIRGCVSALEQCMLDDMVCGEGYKKCLDPTKQFIDENGNVVLGRNITNITAFMQEFDNTKITPEFIKNVSKETSCVNGDGDCIVSYLLKKIGTGATVQDGGLCRAVLDKCQDYTYTKLNKKSVYNPYNDVVINYIQRAMVNIKSAESKIISEYAANCMDAVSECFNEQYSKINSWTTSANADGVYSIMAGSCRNVALTCGYAVFAYDKTTMVEMNEIKAEYDSQDDLTNEEKKQSTKQDQEDTLVAKISQLFAQNMICPDNSTFVTTINEPSPNRTISVDRDVYSRCESTKFYPQGCSTNASACVSAQVQNCERNPVFENIGKTAVSSGVGSYIGTTNRQYASDRANTAASADFADIINAMNSGTSSYSSSSFGKLGTNTISLYVPREDCSLLPENQCKGGCKWGDGEETTVKEFIGSNVFNPDSKVVGKVEGKVAYVNAHCKCNKEYVVWNGACVKQCAEGEYRTSAGTCKKCEAGTEPSGIEKMYTDWQNCEVMIPVAEATQCVAKTTTQTTTETTTTESGGTSGSGE